MRPLSTIIPQIEALNAALDLSSQKIPERIGVSCLKNCGRCCGIPNIDVSIAECLPTAKAVLASEDSLEVSLKILDFAARPLEKLPCPVFIQTSKNTGRCSQYEARPTLCRIYGTTARIIGAKSAKKNTDVRTLVGCDILKDQISLREQSHSHYATMLALGLSELPVFEDILDDISNIENSIGTVRMPIAKALAAAIQLLEFELSQDTVKGNADAPQESSQMPA